MKISYKDFFDFDDSKPVSEIIDFIEKLNIAYINLGNNAKKGLGQAATEQEQLAKATKELMSAFEKINITTEKGQKEMGDLSKYVNSAVSDKIKLIKVENEYNDTLGKSEAATTKLKKAKDDLSKAAKAEAGSVNDLKNKLNEAIKAADAMGDSTDKIVKDEQLKKVGELSKQYKEAKKAIDDAKKVTDMTAGSYNALNQKVIENTKRLKDASVGVNISKKEFNDLQKEIKKDSDSLKEFDNIIGNNQRKVGDYAGEIGKLIPGFGGVAQAAGVANKSLTAIAMNPIGMILVALALIVASVMAYFKSSTEGQEKWNKIILYGSTILETFTDILSVVGKYFIEAFDHPLESIKKLGSAILENIINRFTALGVYVQGFKKMLSGDLPGALHDFGNAFIQSTTGIANGIEKANSAGEKMSKELIAKMKLVNELSAIQNKLAKDRIIDIVEDGKTELKISEDLEKAKDKLRLTDEKRLQALLEAKKLSIEQTQGDIQLQQDAIKEQRKLIEQAGYKMQQDERAIDLLENKIALGTIVIEEIKKLAELEVQEMKLSEESANKKRMFNKQEIALLNEIESQYRDQQKRKLEADKNIFKFELNEIIKNNDLIIKDEESTQEQIFQAINDRFDAQNQLVEEQKQASIKAAQDEALAKIDLNDSALKEIYSQEGNMAENIIAAKQKIFDNDKNYVAEREILNSKLKLIDEDYLSSIKKIDKEYEKNVLDTDSALNIKLQKNIFTKLKDDFDKLNSTIDAKASETLAKLSDAFAGGEKDFQGLQLRSYEDFERAKLAIQKKYENEKTVSQLRHLADLAYNQKKGSAEYLDTVAKISQLELTLTEEKNARLIDIEKQKDELTKQLKQVAVDSALAIIDNYNAAEDQRRAISLKRLEESKNNELILAGNNEEAKANIINYYVAQKNKIEQEQAAANRRRAIFNKALALTEIGISVGKAIAEQLPGMPLTLPLIALIGAIGALQTATVLSQKIPAFKKGTSYSPEGYALVNEEGHELIQSPSGKLSIEKDLNTLTYLQKGSKVFTADQTEKIFAASHFNEIGNSYKLGKAAIEKNIIVQNDGKVLRAINVLTNTIATKKELHINITSEGIKKVILDNGYYIDYLNTYNS